MLVDSMAQCHLGRYTFLAFLDYATLQRISLLRALSLRTGLPTTLGTFIVLELL